MPSKIRLPWKKNSNLSKFDGNGGRSATTSSGGGSPGPFSPITPEPSDDTITSDAVAQAAAAPTTSKTAKHQSMSAPPRFMELPEDPSEDNSPSLGKLGGGSSGYATPHSFRSVSRQSSATLLRGFISRASPKSEQKRPWKETPKHPWFVTTEQTMMYDDTRQRVAQALSCTLSVGEDVTHNALFVGVKILEYSPVPGLEACGRVLLQIWDTMQQVALNRMKCLRLALRGADLLISIRDEIAQLNDVVEAELQLPLRNFEETLFLILKTVQRQINLPGWERYLKKDNLSEEIENCKDALSDCLHSFDRAVMLRIVVNLVKLRQTSNPTLLLQSEDSELPKSLDMLDIPVSNLPSTDSGTATPGGTLIEEPMEEKIDLWRRLVEEEYEQDHDRDELDFRNLLEHAIYARKEDEVFRLLQIGHSELPMALKGLLKDALESRRMKDAEKATYRDGRRLSHKRSRSQTWPPNAFEAMNSHQSMSDSESILQDAESMRREHNGLPAIVRSWTVAREDVRLGDIIGRGRFSTVFKGIWRGHTVAIKVLNPKTVSNLDFNNELTVWRSLGCSTAGKGENILKLYGSSAFAGGLPRMLLSPYIRHGCLSDYLKRCEWEAMGDGPALFLQPGSYTNVDHLKLMLDIAQGMEFIHKNDVLHGDLRASNVFVTDHFRCVIADFGSSRFKQSVTYFEGDVPTHALRWQSPEIMGGRSLMTEHGDVYAYAMTCVEVATFGNVPWPGLSDEHVREAVLKDRSRPPCPEVVKQLDVERLLQAWWSDAPASRPAFKEVARSLTKLRYRSM